MAKPAHHIDPLGPPPTRKQSWWVDATTREEFERRLRLEAEGMRTLDGYQAAKGAMHKWPSQDNGNG